MTATTAKIQSKAHSEEYFGAYRDFWWNLDYLKFRLSPLDLQSVKNVLDVGCGRGHWGQLLSRVFPNDVQLTGVDQETTSLTFATERALAAELGDRFLYQQGDAMALPFADASFDVVTGQTLLIHLKDPKADLTKMLRVLRPKGKLVLVEPNNFANNATASSLTENVTVDEIMDLLKFDLNMLRGEKNLGLGYNSLGDLVPGYLAELSAVDIQVNLSNKTSADSTLLQR